MRTWETKLAVVQEIDHDYDLHAFEVYDKSEKLLGTVYPASIEDMQQCINDLDNGGCPIEDGWEDGLGNVCGLNGW